MSKNKFSKSILEKIDSCIQQGRLESGIHYCDKTIKEFSDVNDIKSKNIVAMTLVNKGFCLGKLGKIEEAIAAYEEVCRRFGNSKVKFPPFFGQVVKPRFC